MEPTTFYDYDGQAVSFLDDDGRSIYLHDGTPVAWLSDEGIYTYSGIHLGWFEHGWVFNGKGDRLLFTDDASGGPPRPLRQARPLRGPRHLRPIRSAREPRPSRPMLSLCWADKSDESLWLLTHADEGAVAQGGSRADR